MVLLFLTFVKKNAHLKIERGIILGMPENENQCAGCENNCCDHFKLFRSREEVEALIKEYPFLKVVEEGLELIGGHETKYRIMECARLLEDGSCEGYPDNRPRFCEETGVKRRPGPNCKLNDQIKMQNE